MSSVGIIFDCDGTLIETVTFWRDLEEELFRLAGAEQSPELTKMLITFTLEESAVFFHEELGLGTSVADVRRMADDFLQAHYAEAAPRPGVLSFVEALAARSIPMVVASSSPQRYLQAGLASSGCLPYMKAVLSVEDVGHSKREPHIFQHACELCGTDPSFTWGFDDSTYALVTLKEAGFKAVGVYDSDNSGTLEQLAAVADLAIASFEELDGATFGL